MGQVYSFQDPLPLMWGSAEGTAPCFDHDHEEEFEEYDLAEDGWPDPGRCIICGTPHCACVGPVE